MSKYQKKTKNKVTSSIQEFSGDIFPQYKVITTRKDVECMICNGLIAKGTKIIVMYGVDDCGFNHFKRFHVDNTNGCYLVMADRLTEDDEKDEKQFILETAAFLNRREWT